MASLTASFSSLTVSQNPSKTLNENSLKTLRNKSFLGTTLKTQNQKFHNRISISRGSSFRAVPAIRMAASSAIAESEAESEAIKAERKTLEQYVKSRLPGGIAAQTLIGTGRRKRSVARVVLQEGTGQIFINYRTAREYLQNNPLWLQYLKSPLVLLGYETKYDVFIKAHGGGLSGQAQAAILGIARAMCKVNPNNRGALKEMEYLTRDDRQVERKKVGLHKARKAHQYSKR